MRHFLMVLVFATLLVLTGCRATDKTQGTPAVEEEKPTIGTVIKAVKENPLRGRRWTKLAEHSVDLDGDLVEEQVELYTAALRDPQGELMWDDGQEWRLLVRDGQTVYPLFSGYVQLGSVYFVLGAGDSERPSEVIVLITTGTGLSLSSYSYSKEKNGFVEEGEFTSRSNNIMYSSIQGYR
ncbi:hypothetical protein SY88_21835 [Clostridiales bacterium PH28_bin88]|nr:hypothetical protein SY88_21835 [Clostridiales bacterium PH28_bin88]